MMGSCEPSDKGNPIVIGTASPGPCDTPQVIGGPVKWSVSQNPDRTRNYKVTYRVQVDPLTMGPLAALWANGLPAIGSIYSENGVADNWAYFTAEREVEQEPKENPGGNQFFLVTCLATNRPGQECTGWLIDNPFAIPDRIRLESVNYQKEAFLDRFDDPLLNSAWEEYRGKEVEYDAHRVRVVIEGNRTTSGLANIDQFMNHVNDATLWGQPARTVKLSHYDVEPRYYQDCTKYWVNKFTFDVATDFDRCLVDEGTKALRGQWDKNPASPTFGQYVISNIIDPGTLQLVPMDPNNPRDFIRYADWHGQNTRVILDGNGIPYQPGIRTGAITGATNASPIVITSVGHGLVNNTEIVVSGVTGNTGANGTFQITVLNVDTFQLRLSFGTGAYTGGGTWSWTQIIGKFCPEVYPEANLLALGIPAVIDPSP